MKDESFHLTALDVRRYDFGSALRGYDKTRVDQFRNQVAEEIDRLTRRALELEEKAKGFHEQLRAFRERDKALNEALVSAQQIRADMRAQADRERDVILREAKLEGERIIEAARAQARRIEDDLSSLAKARRAYLLEFRMIIERQRADLDAIEAAIADQRTVPPATGVPTLDEPEPGWFDAAMTTE